MTPSPCISVCRMDAKSGLCEGCQRTLDEIAAWSVMDDAAKQAVWDVLPQRREALVACAHPHPSPLPQAGEGAPPP